MKGRKLRTKIERFKRDRVNRSLEAGLSRFRDIIIDSRKAKTSKKTSANYLENVEILDAGLFSTQSSTKTSQPSTSQYIRTPFKDLNGGRRFGKSLEENGTFYLN